MISSTLPPRSEKNPRRLSNTWIYSFNGESGFRLMCNLPKEVLDDNAVTDVVAYDLISTATIRILSQLDNIEDGDNKEEMSSAVIAALLTFCKNTKTWETVPTPLSFPGGVHLIVADWVMQSGKTEIRLVAATSETDDPLCQADLKDIVKVSVTAIAPKVPGDQPSDSVKDALDIN